MKKVGGYSIVGAIIVGFVFSLWIGRADPIDNGDVGPIYVAFVGACLLIAPPAPCLGPRQNGWPRRVVSRKGKAMNTEKLKGLAVVSQDEGAKLGQVATALFDPVNLDLRALQVEGEGQNFLVPFDRVAAFGTDAVMVASSRSPRRWRRVVRWGSWSTSARSSI